MRVIPFLIFFFLALIVVGAIGVKNANAEPRSLEYYKEELHKQNPAATVHSVTIMKGVDVAQLLGLPISEHELEKDFLVVAFSVCINDSEEAGGFYAAPLHDDGTFDKGYLMWIGKIPSDKCGRPA